MNNQLIFKYDSVENLTYESDGNYHILIPTFFEFGSYSNERVDFIFDTGAYITIISRSQAKIHGFDGAYTIQKNVPLSGFAGNCLTDIMKIPGFVIGGHRLEGVKVAVPHIDTDVNILGLNVIELFKYLINTETDDIYFALNPIPSIPEPLQCSKIYLLSVG